MVPLTVGDQSSQGTQPGAQGFLFSTSEPQVAWLMNASAQQTVICLKERKPRAAGQSGSREQAVLMKETWMMPTWLKLGPEDARADQR